ncbi:MAG: glycoside hydrolase family 127 protein [Acidobacteriota bacterium]|nr:MAG: glycoside hydrolase family 127 protein [Acidobacteriota bacterium]
MMKRTLTILLLLLVSSLVACGAEEAEVQGPKGSDYPIQPVPFSSVKLTDSFWAPRIRLMHELTIPYAFRQSEETGRVKNFEIAAGMAEGEFCTIYPFDDSDVFKIIEGASYSLQTVPDPKMEAYLDELIAKIGAAQEPDGYLYTNRTIMGDRPHEWAGSRRWELVHELSHELYNLGHMYEAAVAHYQATGKRNFLDIAIKSADLLVRDFGWGKEENYPGHQEIEIGLAKLYRATGNSEYLELAKFFLDVRGPDGKEYSQSHQQVVDQAEAVGHAVRANYMYAGMADVAALTGDERYVQALNRIWEDVVSSKIYITGGVGATSSGEAYGKAYELPNATAYSETCASIANVFWNHRMFLLHGEGKYLDVLERSLYNGVLSGLGLSGDRFFYPNPLQSDGKHERSAWFGCACCPSNLTRFVPSIPGYIYGQREGTLFVNLYVDSEAEIEVAGQKLKVVQKTAYPWDGNVQLTLDTPESLDLEIRLRIPGWAGERAVPSQLYTFLDAAPANVRVEVNGQEKVIEVIDGFAVLKGSWDSEDEISLELPMPVRRIQADPRVKDDQGLVCLQRGPLVYALEWPDNPDGKVLNLVLAKEPELSYRFSEELLQGVGLISGRAVEGVNGTSASSKPVTFTAIPYYAWANRGKGEMTVWIPVGD